jgi:tetratricopeptide (TPR) repeat protein
VPPPPAKDRPKDDLELAKELLSAPELPDGIEFSDLDQDARRELRTLPKGLAETVGKHLVAAGGLMDSDPEAALEHAKYAKAKASRVPIVREALGLVAYNSGNWAEALSELRAVRRMTRTDEHIAIIADSERAVGRPERALDLAKEVDTSKLSKDIQIELGIVAAGARRDLGQLDAAVVALQGADLDPAKRDPWSARLFYAYADNLAAAGRREEAVRWFMYAAEADEGDETDAAERASELADADGRDETDAAERASELADADGRDEDETGAAGRASELADE